MIKTFFLQEYPAIDFNSQYKILREKMIKDEKNRKFATKIDVISEKVIDDKCIGSLLGSCIGDILGIIISILILSIWHSIQK